ncbi:MAG: AraC family transcriptional regulator ligand-binding domain-containing protein [Bacteroidota bacterium]|uniref:AraC family transcriptional regulator ligand-binding domain-containing protein n=1 Tax=Flagellimonas profundi TaxID=2915620 RepID=A0ABS3FBI7_9FLAO|nr:AraC family transcriptional regulator [Allomuricauda profundi]MBO0340336.1 AraC family transcriptional regulator ligand-binding domain-containing protein [Allomuricauda profundi]MEC7772350.1 AraC family transcriptional regulator ligand-binding domain-containing protein [Bacteroidota bacterium]
MAFVLASIYKKAIALAQKEGLAMDVLTALEPGNTTEHIPIESLLAVYELAEQELMPGFGLRQGKQLDSNDYGTLGLSWKTCLRAVEVLKNVKRYMVLVTNDGSITLEEGPIETKIILHRDVYRHGIKTANEVSFVMLIEVLNEVSGKPIKPTRVSFKHRFSSPEYFSEYFDCPVIFDASENALTFHSKDLQVSTIKADKFIHQFLVERMEEEKSKLKVEVDFLTQEIDQLLDQSISSGIPSLAQVSAYLGMSDRTLKRRLAERNLSFRKLVQKKQEETAMNLLSNSNQSIGEIAFLTGFSEQSAFNRAFKRWTGTSPNMYRKGP